MMDCVLSGSLLVVFSLFCYAMCVFFEQINSLSLCHYHPLTNTSLYCLVNVCEQLAEGCYLKAEWRGIESAIFKSQVEHPTRPLHLCTLV